MLMNPSPGISMVIQLRLAARFSIRLSRTITMNLASDLTYVGFRQSADEPALPCRTPASRSPTPTNLDTSTATLEKEIPKIALPLRLWSPISSP